MRKLPILLRPLLPLAAVCMAAAAAAQTGAQTGSQTGETTGAMQPVPASPGEAHSGSAQGSDVGAGSAPLFPGYSARPATESFPGDKPLPVNRGPLSALPYVYALKHRDPAQMTREDAALATSLRPELNRQAALLRLDLSQPGWRYQQVVCPALPDVVLLSFRHGPDPGGSSRFTAVLQRDSSQVEIVPTFAHGAKPFTAAWAKPSTVGAFNALLERQRGAVSLAKAPNWLVVAMCYAELSGYPVQALTSTAEPAPTLDIERLGGSLPQLEIAPDQSAQITFSDVSQPGITRDWLLRFDKRGRLLSVDLRAARQPAQAALKP